MKNKFTMFKEFNQAADELDYLVSLGHYGEEAKRLLEDRDNYEDVDYFIRVLTEWHADKNQYNKIRTYEYISIIFQLYCSAVQANPKESIELIASFKLGLGSNTAMEFMTSYTEYLKVFSDFKLLGKELTMDPNNIAKKLRYAKSISVAYSNGVEYINQTLNLLICLEKILKNETYKFYSINKMSLFDKLDLFNSDGKYNTLLEMVDRDIRNAEAHQNISYILKTNSYKIKFKKSGKIKEKNIPLDLLLEKLILVGNYVQSFEYAGQLLTIGLLDTGKFIEIYTSLFKEYNIK